MVGMQPAGRGLGAGNWQHQRGWMCGGVVHGILGDDQLRVFQVVAPGIVIAVMVGIVAAGDLDPNAVAF